MPLNPALLGQAMVDARRAASGAAAPPPAIAALQLAMATADATAIIAHFMANGLVIVVGTSATGGPVTGTGTIT